MDRTEYSLRSIFGTLPRTTRGLPLVISGDPKGKKFLYCNGNSVIIRDIENPAICDVYTEHATLTTVAKYAPSGFYIASGDQSGKIRIWDTTQKEHILKKEYQPIAGAIRDIGWSNDNQRVAVVGEGRERFGHVFLFDTGTSNGNLSGQSKAMNSIDFRPARPFRIVTASEDNTVAMFEGPPFKFKNLFQQHTRFAHCVRYNADGSIFASCGADGKILLFEGTDGNLLGELIDSACKGNAHDGGVYALCWSPDGHRLLSASGDRTCKIWDTDNKTLLTTFNFGKDVEHQQLACLWQGDFLLSVSLAGFIYYLDPNNPSTFKRIIKGHNKPTTNLVVTEDGKFIYTSDMEGSITRWNADSGHTERLEPKFHKSQVQSMKYVHGCLVTTSMDDTVAIVQGLSDQSDLSALHPQVTKLSSQPRGVCVSRDGQLVAVACQKELVVMQNGRNVGSTSLPSEPNCVAVHPTEKIFAVGGEDSKVRIFRMETNGALAPVKELQQVGAITDLSFSPDGKHLATCDTARRVVPYKLPNYEHASDKEWTFHTARVNCLAWCPDNRHLATGSLDTNVIVWDLHKPGEHPIIIKGAHPMSQITGIDWLGQDRIVTVGQDSNIKQWNIFFQ